MMRTPWSVVIFLLLAACAGPSRNARTPDETFLPSVGSGWNLAARRSASSGGYEAPIAGGKGIYLFRAPTAKEVTLKTPRGTVIELERGWHNLSGGLVPGWRAYSNREGVLIVFYGGSSGRYAETRVLILGEEVKSVRFLSHDGVRLTDEMTSY